VLPPVALAPPLPPVALPPLPPVPAEPELPALPPLPGSLKLFESPPQATADTTARDTNDIEKGLVCFIVFLRESTTSSHPSPRGSKERMVQSKRFAS
jgi:hypothetical protein